MIHEPPFTLSEIRHLLIHAAERHHKLSLKNCHTIGVDSIVLHNDPYAQIKMTRMFVAHSGKHNLFRLRNPDGTFVVAPHSHRYNITITPITGSLINYELNHHLAGPSYTSYAFDSGITHEEMVAIPLTQLSLVESYRHLPIGKAHVMGHPEIHTVIAPKVAAPFTCWIVTESQDVAAPTLYSDVEPDMDLTDLYLPLTERAVQTICNNVLSYLEKHETDF